MRRLIGILALAALGAASGAACGPRVRPEYPEPEDDKDDPMALAPDAGRPAAAPAQPPRPPRLAAGTLRRADLTAVLDRGIGAFLAGVEVQATFEADRFAGWEIVSFWPDEPLFAGVDLLPGDVVRSVNGRAVERPEQLQELWDTLRTAPAIDVEVARNGRAHELHWTIVP